MINNNAYMELYNSKLYNSKGYHLVTQGEAKTEKTIVDSFGNSMNPNEKPKHDNIHIALWSDNDGNKYAKVVKCSENSIKPRVIVNKMLVPNGYTDEDIRAMLKSLL